LFGRKFPGAEIPLVTSVDIEQLVDDSLIILDGTYKTLILKDLEDKKVFTQMRPNMKFENLDLVEVVFKDLIDPLIFDEISLVNVSRINFMAILASDLTIDLKDPITVKKSLELREVEHLSNSFLMDGKTVSVTSDDFSKIRTSETVTSLNIACLPLRSDVIHCHLKTCYDCVKIRNTSIHQVEKFLVFLSTLSRSCKNVSFEHQWDGIFSTMMSAVIQKNWSSFDFFQKKYTETDIRPNIEHITFHSI
jgi:hypothetical protein